MTQQTPQGNKGINKAPPAHGNVGRRAKDVPFEAAARRPVGARQLAFLAVVAFLMQRAFRAVHCRLPGPPPNNPAPLLGVCLEGSLPANYSLARRPGGCQELHALVFPRYMQMTPQASRQASALAAHRLCHLSLSLLARFLR